MNTASVLTIVKNRAEHLRHLIEGLERSRARPDELIVVDMSTQPLELPATDMAATILRLPSEGLPLAQARNLAARSARGDALLFLDVDCIPSQDFVGAMSGALKGNDALICAEVRYLAAATPRNWSQADLERSGIPHPARRFPASGLRPEPNPGLFWSLAFGMRRTSFERLGGFDERFTGYGGEDTDFGFRAKAEDVPLMFQGGAGVFHQHHVVHDPPLQHFEDIVRNACLFHAIWGIWPMDGWLGQFRDMGLVSWGPDRLERLRGPSQQEIALARQPSAARF